MNGFKVKSTTMDTTKLDNKVKETIVAFATKLPGEGVSSGFLNAIIASMTLNTSMQTNTSNHEKSVYADKAMPSL